MCARTKRVAELKKISAPKSFGLNSCEFSYKKGALRQRLHGDPAEVDFTLRIVTLQRKRS
jgi:hypothetical protein